MSAVSRPSTPVHAGPAVRITRHLRVERVVYELPAGVQTNEDLERENPEWQMAQLAQKSGVHARHIAAADETAFDLGLRAARRLLAETGLAAADLDGVIFCTQTPDHPMPSNAFLVHEALGMDRRALAFDYNLACSGYVYGLAIVQGLVEIGLVRRVLLLTADTYSRLINPRDRSTRALFGDGAAATLVSVAEPEGTSRVLDIALASSGGEHRSFIVPAGGARQPRSEATAVASADPSGNIRTADDIHMNGFAVWRFIAAEVPKQIADVLARNGLTAADVDLFLFHQASRMTLDSLVTALKLPRDKVFTNLEGVGNTVSASIPIALADAEAAGRLARGNLVLVSGFGVGLSWGTILMRY